MDNDELKFAKMLEDIKYSARSQGGFIEASLVYETFEDMNLTKEQFDLVFDYLRNNKIGIDEPLVENEMLSDDDRNILEEYKSELKNINELTDGEKEAFIMAAMNNDSEAQKKLIDHYLSQVMEIAKLYSDQGVLIEDLIGEGNLALMEGVTMLGALESPSEADGMLMKLVMDAMENLISENYSESEKDQKMADKVNKVADAAALLRSEFGRKVTVEELVENSKLSKKSILDALELSGNSIEDIEN